MAKVIKSGARKPLAWGNPVATVAYDRRSTVVPGIYLSTLEWGFLLPFPDKKNLYVELSQAEAESLIKEWHDMTVRLGYPV